MDQGFRRGFTAAEKTELWDRWQRGESLKAIGRAFGKPSSSIYFQVSPSGGIRPAPRRRSRLALTLAEREEISRGLAGHQSARSMAKLLGPAPSTVSREINGNGGCLGADDSQIDFVRTYIGANPDRVILSKTQHEEAIAAARGLKAAG
jgi:IS30 family transposase